MENSLKSMRIMDLKTEDEGFYRERHDGGEPGKSTASFRQEIWR